MTYRVINADIGLQCGKDFPTFKEAVQYRARVLAILPPDTRLAIVDRGLRFPDATSPEPPFNAQ